MGWSNVLAQFSEQMALAAAPLAAVLLLSADAASIGWLQTAQTLPFLLLSIPAGLAIDRASRKKLLVGAEVVRALSLLAIVTFLVRDSLSMPLLAALGFAGAVGTVCYSVASPALVPTLVPREQLGEANRWLELGRSTAFAGGPAFGGAVVGWLGASASYVIATGLSTLAVLLLTRLPRETAVSRIRRSLLHDLREGFGFVTKHPLLRPIMLTAVVFNISWFVIQAIFVSYAIDRLDLSAGQVGLVLGIYGAGMIIGATIAPALARRLSFGALIVVGPTCGFAASVVLLSTNWFETGSLAALSFFLFGVGPIIWAITTMTLRQTVTPNAMLGRVSAMIMTATFGARPLGAAIGAITASRFGVEACLIVATAGFATQFMIIAFSSVPRLSSVPEPA